MRPSLLSRVRHGLLAAFLVAGSASSAAALPVHLVAVRTTDVTEADVSASNAKLRMAYQSLVAMWAADFRQLGLRFAAPTMIRYRGAVRSSCGVMTPNNAAYCDRENAIYFDEVFVARQAKAASQELGTDGDMAAVGIIAHEMGHAVAIQAGQESRIPYENESTADCLAGAFVLQSSKNGELEKGDLEEAFFGLAAAGDPAPVLTGYDRVDSRIMRHAALTGHGTRDQRLANFRAGYDGGAKACLPVFR